MQIGPTNVVGAICMSAPAPLRDSIAEALREEILGGTYAPGERLPGERNLALRHGAHRSSVREALRQLEQQGLVSVRQGGGATVRELRDARLGVVRHLLFRGGVADRAMLQQLLEVHEILVVGATRLAVEHAEAAELHEATRLLEQMGRPECDADTYIDSIEALLGLIADATQNLVLHLARQAVNPFFSERFRDVRRRMRPDPSVLRPLILAVQRGVAGRDADAACEAVRRLVRAGRSHALDALEGLPAPHEQETPQ